MKFFKLLFVLAILYSHLGGAVAEDRKLRTMELCEKAFKVVEEKTGGKKLDFLSAFFSKENLWAMTFSFLLGISVALNLYQYVLLKSYIDLMPK